MRFLKLSPDIGLLVLRMLAALSLFLKHGWEKPTNFAAMAAHFPDPIHIGPVPSLVFALVSDAICSIMVAIGMATRWAALVVCINIFVAWSLVHHFAFFGKTQGDHGEVCLLYIAIFASLFFTGAGRYSVDALIAKRLENGKTPK